MDTHHPPRTPASPGRDFRKSYLSSLGFNKDKIEALLEAKIVDLEQLRRLVLTHRVPATQRPIVWKLLFVQEIYSSYKETWSFIDAQYKVVYQDLLCASYLLKHKQVWKAVESLTHEERADLVFMTIEYNFTLKKETEISVDMTTLKKITGYVSFNTATLRDAFLITDVIYTRILKNQTKETFIQLVKQIFKRLEELDADFAKVLKSYKKQVEHFVIHTGLCLFTNCFNERLIGAAWDRLIACIASLMLYEECLLYQIFQYHRKNIMYIRDETDMSNYLNNWKGYTDRDPVTERAVSMYQERTKKMK